MIAFVFPGQGSQYIGMGKDFYENYLEAQTIFEKAEKITGIPVKALSFEGPLEELTKTENLQVCLTTVNIACFEVIKNQFKEILSKIHFVTGHSLGEFSALYAAGVLTLEEALLAVKERGRVMGEVGSSKPSGMYAVINLSLEKLEELVKSAEGPVVISNYNSPSQFVISGEEPYLTEVAEKAKALSAKVVRLKVSAGFHSPLMERAQQVFTEFLKTLHWSEPKVSFISAVTGKEETSAASIFEVMTKQIVSPVRWISAVEYMYEKGVKIFVEVGPKKVLCGLISQILKDKEHKVFNVEDRGTLDQFSKEVWAFL